MVYATLTEYDVDLEPHIKMGEAVGHAAVKGLILHAGASSERGGTVTTSGRARRTPSASSQSA